ncbi:MAG: YebC/PmpR family DNA-binding transcriptional regulator [Nevskiaceae bacterium]|nr:MAG: YebC/PmpR family DNA-binding transcriptional regulator [Nevskiaceae bacterium]TBR74082.1 MAG: YebC/PmpR family DNA-binding transcriptional regulator [Nevskiaceae bacterium]
MGRGPTIAARKNAADAVRAKAFTKLIREITVAARAGGSDPTGNSRLRLAMEKAVAANMPKDTIARATKRGAGELDGQVMEEVRYEGYAPGGIAVMVDCMTDNSTRTVADIRHAFTHFGGSLGTSGSVAFQFHQVGEIIYDIRADAALEDKILDAALEGGADDVVTEDGFTEVIMAPDALEAVKKALDALGLEAISADVVMRPDAFVDIAGEAAEGLKSLIEQLDTLDDVQTVWHNARLPAEAEG